MFHTPFECVKVRLQAKEYSHLRNTWDCVKDMWTREGLLGFYRGFEVRVCKGLAVRSETSKMPGFTWLTGMCLAGATGLPL